MKKYLMTLSILGLLIIKGFTQTSEDKTEALKLGKEAVKIMDDGKYEESIKLLERAVILDPKNHLYPYEIAYAYYLNKQIVKATEYLENVIKTYGEVNPECYQLLGNIYDENNKPNKAVETYLEGIKKFPNSGKLYLELGVVEAFTNKNTNKALEYWETGIQKDPKFASNYYWASKVFCNSEEEIWGVIYGELFINIERNSKRTIEISKLLYDTYRKAIIIKSKKEIGISFSQSTSVQMPTNGGELKLPFSMSYEMIMSLSAAPILTENKKIKELTITSLDKIKTNFIEQWYNQKKEKLYANILFDFQKKLKESGYFEAYNYWTFMKGNEAEFDEWYSKNKDSFDKFATWFDKNPMKINEESRFYRTQY